MGSMRGEFGCPAYDRSIPTPWPLTDRVSTLRIDLAAADPSADWLDGWSGVALSARGSVRPDVETTAWLEANFAARSAFEADVETGVEPASEPGKSFRKAAAM